MNSKLNYWVVAPFLVCGFSPAWAKKKQKDKEKDNRSKTTIDFLVKLEQGLFGETEYKSVNKLLSKAEPWERAQLITCLAQYERVMKKDPVAALKFLAPELLGETDAKAWSKKYDTAVRDRKTQWQKAKMDAYREKRDPPEEPFGMAIDFPGVKSFSEDRLQIYGALEGGEG